MAISNLQGIKIHTILRSSRNARHIASKTFEDTETGEAMVSSKYTRISDPFQTFGVALQLHISDKADCEVSSGYIDLPWELSLKSTSSAKTSFVEKQRSLFVAIAS